MSESQCEFQLRVIYNNNINTLSLTNTFKFRSVVFSFNFKPDEVTLIAL